MTILDNSSYYNGNLCVKIILEKKKNFENLPLGLKGTIDNRN